MLQGNHHAGDVSRGMADGSSHRRRGVHRRNGLRGGAGAAPAEETAVAPATRQSPTRPCPRIHCPCGDRAAAGPRRRLLSQMRTQQPPRLWQWLQRPSPTAKPSQHYCRRCCAGAAVNGAATMQAEGRGSQPSTASDLWGLVRRPACCCHEPTDDKHQRGLLLSRRQLAVFTLQRARAVGGAPTRVLRRSATAARLRCPGGALACWWPGTRAMAPGLLV